jgi:signal peptidase I
MHAANLVIVTERRNRRWADKLLSAQLLLLAGVLIVLAVASLLGGYTVLIERSDSMRPALTAGDLLVTRRVRPSQVRVGDIITFKEPSRPGILLTHRVTELARQGEHYSVVTRGDANTGSERWSMPASGTVGRLALRLPKLGWVASWLARPQVRFTCVAMAGLLLGVELLRRIWRTPQPDPR